MFQGEGPGGGGSGRQGRQLGGCRGAGPGRDDGDSDESDAEGSRAEFGTCRGRTLWKWEVVRGRALRELLHLGPPCMGRPVGRSAPTSVTSCPLSH